MNTRDSMTQYIMCVKDSTHLFKDKIYQLTGLTPQDYQQPKSSLGVPILPGYEVKIVGEFLFVGQLMLKISDLKFVYDHIGLSHEIKQVLIENGCYYKRIDSFKGWFNLSRISVKKATCVDAIRLSNGFNNYFLKSTIKSDLSLVYALQKMASKRDTYQPLIDKLGDAYILGYHCHEGTLCNVTEGLAAKTIWNFTDKLIEPFGFRIKHRVSDRLHNKKQMIGNYRTIARTKADALFNTAFLIFEEEMWSILEELGLNYLGVGGFTHFSLNTDLSWMGLPLDLCNSLKKAGHIQSLKSILNEEITKKHIKKISGFKGERLYYVSPVGQKILFETKEDALSNPCVFNGQTYNSFKEALRKNVLEFDYLLENICERLYDEQLFINDKEMINSIGVKLWRLVLEWEYLPISQRNLLRNKVFRICQEEIKKTGFQPIVWMESKYIEQQIEKDIDDFEKLSFLHKKREDDYINKHGYKAGQLSPRLKEYSYELKELPIKWINLE